MSLSSLQSAFDGGDYLTDAFGGLPSERAFAGFIARHVIGTRKHLAFCGGCPARDDIDCADVLIYGAPLVFGR
jgi:hypothetical protein